MGDTMKRHKILFISMILCGLLIVNYSTTLAVPPLPASYFGTVNIDGENAPSGTEVQAVINGIDYATVVVEEYGGDTVYSINIPGDDLSTETEIEGGVEGDEILFYIDGILADQRGVWSGSSNIRMDLTADSFKTQRDIYLSNNTVEEGLPAGTSVGVFTTEDDTPSLEFEYTLVSGDGDEDNGSFSIPSSSDTLLTAEEFDIDLKDSYSIRVRSEDQDGYYSEKVFTIQILETSKADYIIYLPLFLGD
jgi:hypothetical protein